MADYERRRKILLGTPEEVEEKMMEVVAVNTNTEIDLNKIIQNKIVQVGKERFLTVVRQLMLQAIDMFWVEHLEIMDYTRSSVNLRAYGQRDPLVEYKKEGLRLFKEMQFAINNQILSLLPHVGGGIITPEAVELKEVHEQAQVIGGGDGSSKQIETPANKKPEVGRNDPCPCGAINPITKEIYKWKKCGMINALHHRK